MTRRKFYSNYHSLAYKKMPNNELTLWQFHLIQNEFYEKWTRFWIESREDPCWDISIPTKFTFSRYYSRKIIVRIFSMLGLTITDYRRKYGKTIVHFKETSNS